MKKSPKMEFECIVVRYKCGEDRVEAVLQSHDISSSSQECELCGSHGSVEITVTKCPKCKQYHEFTINEW